MKKVFLVLLIIMVILIFLSFFYGTAALADNRHHSHGNFWLGFGLGMILAPPPIFYRPYYPPPSYYAPHYRYYEPSRRTWAPGRWERRWNSYYRCRERVWIPGHWE